MRLILWVMAAALLIGIVGPAKANVNPAQIVVVSNEIVSTTFPSQKRIMDYGAF